MGGRKNDGRVKSALIFYLRPQGPDDGSRHGKGPEKAFRKVQGPDQVIVPICRIGGKEAGRRSIRILLLLDSCQTEIQIVRNHEKALGFGKPLRLLKKVRFQLEYGIEDDPLDAGSLIELFPGNLFIDRFITPFGPVVPVGIAGADHPVLFIEQDIVDSPGVNAHGNRDFSCLPALFHAGDDLGEKAVHIPDPVGSWGFRPVIGKDLPLLRHDIVSVIEAVDFLKDNSSLFHMGQHVAAR